MSEFSLSKNPAASLVRDLKHALRNKKYELDGADLVVPSSKIRAGGVFTSSILRHPAVQKAIEAGDKLAEAAARQVAFMAPDAACERMMESVDHNQIPDAGINFLLDLLFGSATKISTWYHGPFTTSWSSFAGAQSNWAGATGGPLATELPEASYTETNRRPAMFANPAASKSITASEPTRFTLAAGTSGITLHGSTLNETNTVAYNATDKILLAAAQFGSAKSGLGEGDKIDIEYMIEGSST